jgi:hypothetical protein
MQRISWGYSGDIMGYIYKRDVRDIYVYIYNIVYPTFLNIENLDPNHGYFDGKI